VAARCCDDVALLSCCDVPAPAGDCEQILAGNAASPSAANSPAASIVRIFMLIRS
jgi:hypothetical protein